MSSSTVVIVFVLLTAYLPGLWSRGPWFTDEVRYAEVARQVNDTGQHLVLQLNGEVYDQKPPLFFWALALLERLVGDYLLAGRLLALLATALSIAIVVSLGRLMFGRSTGLLGGLLYATLAAMLERGSRGVIDTFLLPWILLAMVGLLQLGSAHRQRQRWMWCAAAWIGLCAACLTKGPIGLVIPVLGALTIGFLWRGRPGLALSPALLGVLMASGLTLLWVWLVSREVGDWFWEQLVEGQALGRAVKAVSHPEPWYFYLAESPGLIAPWIVFLPGAVAVAASRQSHDTDSSGRRAALGLCAFLFLGLTLFSMFPGKRTGYVLPLLPVVALLVARGVACYQVTTLGGWAWLMSVPLRLLSPVLALAAGVLILAAIALPILAAFVDLPVLRTIPQLSWLVATVAATLLSCLAWTTRHQATQRPVVVVRSFAVGLAVLWCCVHLTLFPAMDTYKSRAAFGEMVAQVVPDGERLVLLDDSLDGRVNFYTRKRQHEVVDVEDLRVSLNDRDELWVAAHRRAWQALPPELRTRFLEPKTQPGNLSLVLLRKVILP